jgi:serine/threonine protein kinase
MSIYSSNSSSPRYRASYAAHKTTEILSKQSKLPVLKGLIQPLNWTDIRQQSILGKGAFSEVFRVHVPQLNGKECALKCLSPEITDITQGDFDLAAIDLAMEADLLSRLTHDNIIMLHGVYGEELKSSYIDSRKGYFLILDLLEDTLPKRLGRFRAKERRTFSNSVSNTKLLQRIDDIALGVANGMEYLHNNGVLFRDLKPDNVGFTREGKPVIFDFGFAREMHTLQEDEIAGSLRYMSPEMAFGKNPSLPSDVYSFGILLFEICTLQKPFKQFKTQADFTERVLKGGYRPSLSPIHSKSIRYLISRCWDSDPTKRPNMTSIVKVLRIEIALANDRIQSDSVLAGHPRSFSGNPHLTRRNGASNFRWDSQGKSTAQHSSKLSRRASFQDGKSLVSNLTCKEQGNFVSDLSLAETSSSGSKKSLMKKKLSWSRSSFSSMGSDATSISNDSNKISDFSLGRLRKPFNSFSFGKVLSKPEPQRVTT